MIAYKPQLNIKMSRELNANQIVNVIAEHYKLTPEELTGHCRKRNFSYPREILQLFLYFKKKMSYKKIANFLDRKDHTTIRWNILGALGHFDTDSQVQTDIAEIEIKINNLPAETADITI